MSSTLIPARGSEAASSLAAVDSRLGEADACQLSPRLPSEPRKTRLEALINSAIVVSRVQAYKGSFARPPRLSGLRVRHTKYRGFSYPTISPSSTITSQCLPDSSRS